METKSASRAWVYNNMQTLDQNELAMVVGGNARQMSEDGKTCTDPRGDI